MRVVVLEYHDVVTGSFDESGFPGAAADSYKLRESLFAEHLAMLARTATPVVNDVRRMSASAASTRLPAIFTFDDGGAGALVAADCLERHGWRGHFLMTTSRVGERGFLSAPDLRTLHARGHIIGSHSRSHPTRMARMTRDQVAREWTESCNSLADILGAAIDVASVPGGYYASWIAREASHAGIRWLFTSEPVTAVEVVGECRVLGRFTLRQHSPATRLPALVAGYSLTRGSEWAYWNVKKLAKWAAGDAYLRLRSSVLRDRPPSAAGSRGDDLAR